MAGKQGQGKIQQRILRELETSPVLSLRVLNPDGNRSRQKALRRSTKKLVQSGAVTRLKIIVPSSRVPSIHSLVAKAGTCILGLQTTVRTETDKPVQEISEVDGEGKEPMTLDDRIEKLQEKINSDSEGNGDG